MTAFQRMALELRDAVVAGSIGKGETFSLRSLPANNCLPGGALLSICDGDGGAVTIIIGAPGVALLHDAAGAIRAATPPPVNQG